MSFVQIQELREILGLILKALVNKPLHQALESDIRIHLKIGLTVTNGVNLLSRALSEAGSVLSPDLVGRAKSFLDKIHESERLPAGYEIPLTTTARTTVRDTRDQISFSNTIVPESGRGGR